MNILIVDPAGGGGISTHASGIAEQMEDSGHNALMLSVSPHNDSDFETVCFNRNTKNGSYRVFSSLWFCYIFLRVCFSFKPSIVYCSLWYPVGTISVLFQYFFSYKTAIVVHGREVYNLDGDSRLKNLVSPLRKWTLTTATHVFAVSDFTRKQLENIGVKNVVVCGNGINPGSFEETDYDASSFPFDPENSNYILTVARLVPHKGHDNVIKAVAQLQAELPDLKYAIVGRGSHKSELNKIADNLGVSEKIYFFGYVDNQELPYLYSNSDLFVMTSRIGSNSVEGFGISYLEAGICGTPVIGSTEGGASMAIDDGKSGFLLDPNDVGEIAKHINILISNEQLSEEMGDHATEYIQQNHTWEVVCDRILNEIKMND